jgi:hypothetical protein
MKWKTNGIRDKQYEIHSLIWDLITPDSTRDAVDWSSWDTEYETMDTTTGITRDGNYNSGFTGITGE